MPSSYTIRNRLEKQAAGENNNTWGARLNDNVIDLVDESTDGVIAFALSGTRLLSVEDAASDEARRRVIHVTGGTGGTVTIPNVQKNYLVRNASSGNVTFTTGSGTSTVVMSGAVKWIFCTGANSVYQTPGPDFGALAVSTTGAGSFGSLTCAGAATISGFSQFTQGLRATGNSWLASGTGLELRHDGTNSYITSTVRPSGADLPLIIIASAYTVYQGGAVKLSINATTQDNGSSIVTFSGIGTTASAANAWLDPIGVAGLKRSTSSIRYKKDVENVEPAYADAILQLRPVWYRSGAAGDNPDWGHWGLIAEEVAPIDRRLVHWSYAEDDYEHDDAAGDESDPSGPHAGVDPATRRLKNGAQLIPDGVQYERLTVLLLDIIKRHEARIALLESA